MRKTMIVCLFLIISSTFAITKRQAHFAKCLMAAGYTYQLAIKSGEKVKNWSGMTTHDILWLFRVSKVRSEDWSIFYNGYKKGRYSKSNPFKDMTEYRVYAFEYYSRLWKPTYAKFK